MDPLFAPPGESWQSVSPKLMHVRRIVLSLNVVVLMVALSVPLWFLWEWAGLGLAAGVGITVLVWGLLLIPRNWRAWGYAERADDFLVTHGVLFRKLTVVPYGRMQFVDVASGPLERRYGLATVQLHTASPATDAKVPGLPAEEAARLRDRLSALGEAQAAGL
ncbi:MAG: PH domain-containing protein [Jiangellaceae bacterium]